jgi:uncharacterized DUF497 family protein
MEYEWDENKERFNIDKHGIGFDTAIEIFAGNTHTFPGHLSECGEARKVSIGEIDDGTVITVVHTRRGHALRIISARPASRKERILYYDLEEE